jgi:pseudouridine-5'-phosphate glycosidase
MDRPLIRSEEVATALNAGRPVVALESTIIAHGMPHPTNLDTAQAVEAAVRGAGTVPATIAVLDGVIRVGLSASELERVATSPDLPKLSRRDLPFAIAQGGSGATTVAATMIGAHMAGIRVFATGGIGGVHRGAEASFDISADLEELARTPVAVVCAGAKLILDLPKTLEVLETRGVPVVGYGTDDFPAFYCRSSGLPVPQRIDSAADVARLIAAQDGLPGPCGAVIAVPVPEGDDLPRETIDRAIDQALEEAEGRGITGKEVTPFLLERVVEITGGASLTANIALVRNNARVAGEIAAALAALRTS